jgi:hypothetical protein
MQSGGDIPFEYLLVWMMQYVDESNDWQNYDEALLALMAKTAVPDDREILSAEGDDWWLEVGPVDLEGDIVTIQRGERLIAAISPRSNGTLRASAFYPPDAKAARYLIGVSRKPGPDSMVNMRENNWEYALDSSAGMGSVYADYRGESYLSRWKFGLGVWATGEKIGVWYDQREVEPIPARLLVGALGTYYSVGYSEQG